MKRSFTAVFLTLFSVFLILSLISCSLPGINYGGIITGEPGDTSAKTSGISDETAGIAVGTELAHETTELYFTGSERLEEINFDTTVSVFHWKEAEFPEFDKEEALGDIVGDALYLRNKKTEERLNIEFEWESVSGTSTMMHLFADRVEKYNNAGVTHDIIAAYSRSAGALMLRGLLCDVNSVADSYLDLDYPWWPSSLTEDCMIGDSLYLLSGDISTNLIYFMHTVLFNADLAKSHGLGDLYADVEEGEWTLDRMMEHSRIVYADTDGSGGVSEGDRIGFGSTNYCIDAFYTGSGLRYTERGEGNEFVKISGDLFSQKCTDLYNKINGFSDAYITSYGSSTDSYREGNMLFLLGRFHVLNPNRGDGTVRNLDFSYGILPVPKYDAAQEEYYTYTAQNFSFWGIPAAAENPSMSSAVLECLAMEGYRNTTPAIFENNMKYRYADAGFAPAQMFDLMRETIRFDLGLYTVTSMFPKSQIKQPVQNYEDILNRDVAKVNNALKELFK